MHKDDAAAAVMTARPAALVNALDELIRRSQRDMLGAFAVGPTSGTDYLPLGPVEAMRSGTAHRGTAHRRQQRRRGQAVHPVAEAAADERADDRRSARRPRTRDTANALPLPTRDIRDPAACIRLGGDFAFGTAAWQIAEAHSLHAPTYLYRYDYAPRTLHWSGLGATHATELFAVFDVYRTRFGSLLTAAADGRSARRVSDDVQTPLARRSAAPVCPATTGRRTATPTAR